MMEERRRQQREAAKERQRRRRERLREEERDELRHANSVRVQQRRQNMNAEQRAEYLGNMRIRAEQRRNDMNAEQRAEYVGNMRIRVEQRRNDMNAEQRAEYVGNMRIRVEQRRHDMNAEQRAEYLDDMRIRAEQRRHDMNAEQMAEYLGNMRIRAEERRNDMNAEQRAEYLGNRRNPVRQQRNNYVDNHEHVFYIGAMNVVCQYCRALRFRHEPLNCCHNGKVSIPDLQEYPDNLKLLFDINNQEGVNFRNNIRNYNSAFAFASFGANIKPPPGNGPYCFRLQGQTYHYASTLHPNETEQRRYGQLYIIDTNEANNIRVHSNANVNCLYSVFEHISTVMNNNPYAAVYKNMRTIEIEEEERALMGNFPPRQVTVQFIAGPDARRFNAPTNNEVAAIFLGEHGAPPIQRDIVVYPIGEQKVRIPYISCHLDPMVYPLIFPHGEQGWHINIPHVQHRQTRVRNKVTMQQFYNHRLAIRENFSALHRAGKLLQQYIVDAYVKVEGCRLKFVENNQAQLRVAMYTGLMDHLARNGQDGDAGIPVILPSTFNGSPRNMQQSYQDAMAIVAKYGKPDLFLTYTCNPKCREITENLGLYGTAQYRPDLVVRVFKMHLNELMIDITERHVLGVPVAHIHVIELQKRGLPHCHMLIMLRSEDKIRTKEQIDDIVSAEIPPLDEPELRELVRILMIHGPCGVLNPNSVCMTDGLCQKQFPKNFQNETITTVSGYPAYRRRNNGDTVQVGTHQVDNRFVVPFNRYLLKKYRAHINVEVCSSVKSVKYLFKYVYKGHDCAMMEIRNDIADNNEPAVAQEYNEIRQYLSCRYVSSPEAFWRLSEFKMHGQSHTVYRLALHLPDEQQVYYRAGEQQQAGARAQQRHTHLTAWFHLNQIDENARNYLYCDIPEHYVFNKQNTKWTRRVRYNNIVTRMYSASPRNAKKFYLRMLLLHIPGATSFTSLRTIEGEQLDTFKEACIKLRLLDSDNELQETLSEAATYQMPRQLLNMFAMICLFNQPLNALQLWNDNKHFMIEDLLQNNDNHTSENIALHLMDAIFRESGMNCAILGLPEPEGQFCINENGAQNHIFDPNLLNNEQREVFNAIIDVATAVERGENVNRLFYLDAPGGSGKTFIFNMIHDYLTARNIETTSAAWTGIAATLLKGGKTLHSIFKLPVPLSETSVCNVPSNSEQANMLKNVKAFIIDEASMIPAYALAAIDKCLRDIMNTDSLFGGKIILLGGDFRQVLPVVPRAPPTAVLDVCLKRSYLWHQFRQMKLTENMRANADQQEFSRWLLQLGNGLIGSTLDNVAADTIDIPTACISNNSLVSEIFDNCTAEEMRDRVILSPKNSDCLSVNEEVLSRLPTDSRTYLSTDYVSCDTEEEGQNYPMEFINSLTPSGTPPHRLNLKVGSIVMLLRNLAISQGLCNGTRLEVVQLHDNCIEAMIISGSHSHEKVLIPRIKLTPSDANIPFTLHRTQFPVRLSYSMTINKAQGQTFDRVGIYLPQPCFTHGQLYVAFSRARAMNSVRIRVKSQNDYTYGSKKGIVFTRNIVYKEIL